MTPATKEEKLALIDETAAAFNRENRSISFGGTCLYFCEGTSGCAIGRKIDDKDLCRALDHGDESGVSSYKVFSRLPDSLKRFGQSFLVELQSLHDWSEHWDQGGLSDEGRDFVRTLRRQVERDLL